MSLVVPSSLVKRAAPTQVAASVAMPAVASPGAPFMPLRDGTIPEAEVMIPGTVGSASGRVTHQLDNQAALQLVEVSVTTVHALKKCNQSPYNRIYITA
jgi:hypothetical protein